VGGGGAPPCVRGARRWQVSWLAGGGRRTPPIASGPPSRLRSGAPNDGARAGCFPPTVAGAAADLGCPPYGLPFSPARAGPTPHKDIFMASHEQATHRRANHTGPRPSSSLTVASGVERSEPPLMPPPRQAAIEAGVAH
jgi:hypothetical protein